MLERTANSKTPRARVWSSLINRVAGFLTGPEEDHSVRQSFVDFLRPDPNQPQITPPITLSLIPTVKRAENGAIPLRPGELHEDSPKLVPAPENKPYAIQHLRSMDRILREANLPALGTDKMQDRRIAGFINRNFFPLGRTLTNIIDGYHELLKEYRDNQAMWDGIIRNDEEKLRRLLQN